MSSVAAWQATRTIACGLIDDAFERRSGLLPTRVVVVARSLMQADRDIIVRAHPLRGVNTARLQRREDLRPRKIYRRAAGKLERLPADAWDTHLQAAQIGHTVDAAIEPAAHLYPGVARGEWYEIERRINFAP